MWFGKPTGIQTIDEPWIPTDYQGCESGTIITLLSLQDVERGHVDLERLWVGARFISSRRLDQTVKYGRRQ